MFIDKRPIYKIDYRKSLEVIVQLCNYLVIPKEFLDLFIAHSVELCDNTEDRVKRDRSGRILCVFVKSLRNGK